MTFEEHIVRYEDDKEIFYLAAGPSQGPLIIFLHGWPAIAKTWKVQLQTFASLGFRVVAPDLPGYGRSTARKVQSDYAQEKILTGLLALLADTGRDKAVWVGHDWGCGPVWTLANTRPDVCQAVAGLAVPYGVLEYGLDEAVKHVDRKRYPEDEYPWGQWGYQAFYEQSFDKANEWFESDIAGFLKVCYIRASPDHLDKPAVTANVVKDNGWFGGAPKPPSANQIPDGLNSVDSELMGELVAAYEKTGFYPADAWYMNHKANNEYNTKNAHDGKKVDVPVLFIEAKWDNVCDTVHTTLTEPMRKFCSNLTYVSVDAGHWVALESPSEVNAALTKWLVERVKDWWPSQALPTPSKI
ncbi:alpha/beta-hydrolase [Polychaeton citri CBS 116435]|uniref:Alpha/beta-hydrolase n=1 Tax=Polychaeton citri CBS 116435 TaxID=1314669 RepID=A0A9P4ULT2_9PEZI|nr:alpha/beta-hydrolase [Polychaeton citri CBS 116435]